MIYAQRLRRDDTHKSKIGLNVTKIEKKSLTNIVLATKMILRKNST